MGFREYVTPDNRKVNYIIRALNRAGHKIRHDTFLPFIEAVRPLVDDYPHDYEYAEATDALLAQYALSRREHFVRTE